MHSKTFICEGVQSYKNYLCILVDSMHSKPSFVEVFELEKITTLVGEFYACQKLKLLTKCRL